VLFWLATGLAGCKPASTFEPVAKVLQSRHDLEQLAIQMQWARDAMDVSADWCARRHLVAREFSGVIHNGENFRFVGILRSADHEFKIFSYKYNNPINMHGTHRLLVFTKYCEYLGGYLTDDEPLRVEGAAVVFRKDPEFGDNIDDRIRFKGGYPPRFAVPNGGYSELDP
jgi:hypothetical protein